MPELKALGGGPDFVPAATRVGVPQVLDLPPPPGAAAPPALPQLQGWHRQNQPLSGVRVPARGDGPPGAADRPRFTGARDPAPGPRSGERLERTVFDTLVNGVPITDVILPNTARGVRCAPGQFADDDHRHRPSCRWPGASTSCSGPSPGCLDRYEFIVMDAPPSFGLLNLNALMACDDLLVPVLPGFPVVSRSQIAVRDAGPARGRPEPPDAADSDRHQSVQPHDPDRT